MTETYNPREQTFIKAPEHKVCPTCGQLIVPEAKPLNNHMNVYVNDSTKVEFAINSNEPYVTVKDVKLRRKNYTPPAPEAAKVPTTTPTK